MGTAHPAAEGLVGDLDTRVAMIQDLLPIGLEAVREGRNEVIPRAG